jgi:tRNA nucleotidyltransferase/poly(A) polymerase
MNMNMNKYAVGGFVRDRIMSIPSKDLDFSVEADSFESMVEGLEDEGVEIYLTTPEYFTVRGKHPKWGAVDYVWARKDGPYSDGRRPDYVEPGTLEDDLERRDFTMNALAVRECDLDFFIRTGSTDAVMDFHGGLRDIENKVIHAVGIADNRLKEDALRVIRAMRFAVTKNMTISMSVTKAINSIEVEDAFRNISVDRISAELTKMIKHEPKSVFMVFYKFPQYADMIIDKGVWFKPTLEKR